MKQNKFTKTLAWLLLTVFCSANIPVSLIHLFENHHDTIDLIDNHAPAPELSAIHVHCDFLHWTLSCFHLSNNSIEGGAIQIIRLIVHHPESLLLVKTNTCFYLRGPPSLA